jgi:hypothetical protein
VFVEIKEEDGAWGEKWTNPHPSGTDVSAAADGVIKGEESPTMKRSDISDETQLYT